MEVSGTAKRQAMQIVVDSLSNGETSEQTTQKMTMAILQQDYNNGGEGGTFIDADTLKEIIEYSVVLLGEVTEFIQSEY